MTLVAKPGNEGDQPASRPRALKCASEMTFANQGMRGMPPTKVAALPGRIAHRRGRDDAAAAWRA